jgi:hypothetical protein
MNNIIRKLEIYYLIGIGDKLTIKLNRTIDKIFSNLVISKQIDGNILFSKNDNKLILQDVKRKYLNVSDEYIWEVFEYECNIDCDTIEEIMRYLMRKMYKISKHRIIGFDIDDAKLMFRQYKIFIS